jgi:prepilin-type N-terminal cleavage/methylation domain-containing protein
MLPWQISCSFTMRNMSPIRTSARGFSLIEMLFVVGLIGVIGAISVPIVEKTIAGFRLSGNARGVSNAIAVAKIRAASTFTRVRLYADLTTGTHQLQVLDKTTDPANPHWVTEGGATPLAATVTYGYGPVASPPPNSQTLMTDTPPCTTDPTALLPNGSPIGSTWCLTFNSRGIPVDGTGAPAANGVLYITDGTAVYAVTVAATGMIRLWRTYPKVTPTWTVQ